MLIEHNACQHYSKTAYYRLVLEVLHRCDNVYRRFLYYLSKGMDLTNYAKSNNRNHCRNVEVPNLAAV